MGVGPVRILDFFALAIARTQQHHGIRYFGVYVCFWFSRIVNRLHSGNGGLRQKQCRMLWGLVPTQSGLTYSRYCHVGASRCTVESWPAPTRTRLTRLLNDHYAVKNTAPIPSTRDHAQSGIMGQLKNFPVPNSSKCAGMAHHPLRGRARLQH